MLEFHPFIVYGSPFTLKNLQELGFKTFDGFIDETYDSVVSPFKRMQLITEEILKLCSMEMEELKKIYYDMYDILFHNRELMKEYGVYCTKNLKKTFLRTFMNYNDIVKHLVDNFVFTTIEKNFILTKTL